jgi:hypothetical protein
MGDAVGVIGADDLAQIVDAVATVPLMPKGSSMVVKLSLFLS